MMFDQMYVLNVSHDATDEEIARAIDELFSSEEKDDKIPCGQPGCCTLNPAGTRDCDTVAASPAPPGVASVDINAKVEAPRLNGQAFSDWIQGLYFRVVFEDMQKMVHDTAVSKGWWEEKGNNGEKIALMHSELSEMLEAYRHGNPPSEHIPAFSAAEEEAADLVIRVMDFAADRGLRLAEAIVAKNEMNKGREHMHGGKLF